MENIGMQNATEKPDVAGVVDAARGAGVELWVEGRRLRFRSITGELPEKLREQLRSRRDELIAHLRADAASSITIGPVGANQRGLWFLHRLVPDTCAYNVAFAARVHGAVDTVALGDALQALVDRHEALRASYPERDGEPVRTVHGYRPVAFEIRDAAALTEQQLQEAVAADYSRPFDLTSGPLFRAALYTRSANESVLLLAAHHLAVDGTSLFVLLDELFAIYDSGVTGTPGQLRSVATQYSDFIAWQSDMLREDDHEAGFWAQQLDPQSPLLELPIDHPRPRMPALRGASVRDTLSSELGQRVARFSREAGVTDFVTLLSVWYAFLFRLTGQDDLTVGTPVHGRASVRFERTVGDLINMVPLRARNIRSLSFRELLGHTRKVVMDALAHQDYPLPLMVERLGHRGDHIGAPFQSLFVLQDFGQFGNIERLFLADAAQRFRFGSLELSNFPLHQQEGQFDVSLEACRQDDNIVCIWKYDTQLFEPATIHRWTTEYQTLLADALERPDVPVAELRILSDADLALTRSWNSTARPYDLDTTLHALIEAQAARTPDAIAVSSREFGAVSHLTFRELERRANALAVRLQQLGVGRDTPVAVSMERSAELVVALLAVLKAGGAYVPIDPGYPAERRSFMLEDCGASVVLTQSAIGTSIPGVATVSVDAIWDELDIDAQPEERAVDSSLAYIIYTSGSTGRPKGAMIEHRSIVNRLLWMQEHFELAAADVVLQKTPYSFDVSVWEFFWPLMAGARLVMAKPEGHKDPAYLASLIRTEGVNTLHFVPSMLNAFLDTVHGPELPSLKRVICSGEALSSVVRDRFFHRFPDVELTNLYGPTEAAVDVSWYRCMPDDRGTTVPIGWPVANTQLHILDERLQPVPIGVPGELYIGGVQVGRGYLNRPELTAERFVADPFAASGRLYRTGDKARFLNEGAIEFLGRLDHQVKVRGFRIELGEIEARLREHPDVRDVVVVAKDERLIGYVVSHAAVNDLRSWLGATLPDYMVPSVFVALDALPLSPNGKVDRKALPEPSSNQYADRAFEPPVGPTEQVLAQIWAELLGVEKVGRRDNFFALGGHSLLAVRLVERMRREQLHADIPVLFTAPTLADLAAAVGGSVTDAQVPPNDIPSNCNAIRPAMLTLTELTQAQIDTIVQQVPGGARNVQDIYPLAPLQEGILFHHMLETEGDPYLLTSVASFETRERLDAFLQAVQAVVDRQDILRTAVVWEGLPEPHQVVWRSARLPVQEVLLDPAAGDVAHQLQERFDPGHWRLDVRQAPLLQFCVAADPEQNRWLCLLLLHHLAGDHMTLEVMLEEVRAFLRGAGDGLPEPLPFRNFVAQTRSAASQTKHQEFFRELLGDVNEPTAPYGLMDVQGAGRDLVEAHQDVDPDVGVRLREQARRLGVSAASVCHIAWSQVLARIAGREDVVFGTVVFGRMASGTGADRVMGPFINTLPLRIRIDGTSAAASVQHAHRVLAELMRHEHASLALAQQCSQVRAPAPLFSALLNYRHSTTEATSNAVGVWDALPGNYLMERTNYPLTVSVDDLGADFRVTVQVQKSVDPMRVCKLLHTALERLVDALEHSPEQPICDIEVLPDAEWAELSKWNETRKAYHLDTTLHALIEAQVAQTPDAVAVTARESGAAAELTFDELNRRSNALAVRLQEIGVGRDTPVAVSMERSAELVIALVAVLKAGGAYVPIDPGYPAERRSFMLEDCGASVVLTQSAIGTSIPGVATISVDAIWNELDIDAQPEERADESSLAYIIYTSGSTGRPKGAMIEHRSIVNRLLWMQEHFELTAADVVLQKTPYSFDVSVWEFFWPLITGARLVMAKPEGHKDPTYLESLIRAQGVTTLHFVPSMLNAFLQARSTAELASLKRVICSGEALSSAVRDRFFQALPQVELTNLYGPTEAAVDVSWYRCTANDRGTTVPIGWPVANTQLHILDERLQPLPIGVPGELYVGGVQVGRGYLNRPELTAERFVADPLTATVAGSFIANRRLYRTGDKVRFLNDGAIEFLGRLDHQVKVRGFRIELGEIEARLREHPDVRDVVVVANNERLIAYVVSHAAADDLRSWLGATLPDYMVPSVFVALDALPLSPNGKVDRKALPEPSSNQYTDRAFELPVGPTEQVLAQIWAELLGVEKVGRRDNFFALGGHSLLAVRLVERMRRHHLHADIPVLFTASTLADLAAAIGGSAAEAQVPPNGIPSECDAIRPAMLTLTELTQTQIDTIVQHVPGGARNVQDIYPLAPLQEGILFHHMLETEGDPYLLTSVASFETRERLDAFFQAVQAVVDRQDILRTAVVWEGLPEPHQVVWRSARLPVQEVVLDPAAGDVAYQLQERFDPGHWRLDVRQAPMLQFCVAEDPEHNRWLCLLLLHHLAGDHMTFEVMLEEVRAFLLGAGDALPEPLPFRNFVAQTRSAASQKKHQEFFRELLGDVNEPTAPYGLMDVQGAGRDLVEAHQDVDSDVGVRLREQARRLGVSAASVCHIAWSQVLARIAGREDVVFGTVVFGRMAGGTGADRVMGPFINTLPLRLRIDGTSAAASVQHAHRLLAELMRHEHASLALAQQCSQVRAPAPLFSALLNYRHSTTEATSNAVGVWDVLPSNYLMERTNYPLMVSVDDLGAGFRVTVQVQKSVDPMRVCALLHNALERLVDALEHSPEQPIRDIAILPDAERAQRNKWNETRKAYHLDTTLHALIEAQIAQTPDAVAVTARESGVAAELTFDELNRRSNALAVRLQEIGVGRDTPVAVSMERSAELVVALLAVLKAGGAYVPIDPGYPAERRSFMLEDCGASVVLTQSAIGTSIPGVATISVDAIWDELDIEAQPEERAAAGDLAYIIYTSGSTGRPKGAMIEHRSIVNRLLWMQEHFELTATDVVLQKTPYSFDVSVWEFFWPLMTGARLVMAKPEGHKDPAYLASLIRTEGVSTMHFVPSMLNAFLETVHGPELPSLKRVICSGEALSSAVRDRFFHRFPSVELTNLYGPTEAAVDVSWYRCTATDRGIAVPIGWPVANTQLHILDGHMQPVPIGVPGELYIGGVQVGRGYLNRPELTPERFVADPFTANVADSFTANGRLYRTGDKARYLNDGAIEFLGRLDHQVKVRGFRIELGEIEARLREHPDVRDVVVVARDERLIGYIVSHAAVDDLRSWLSATVPDYMVPSVFVALDALPLSPNGKVDRKALPEPGAIERVAGTPPQTDTEIALAAIWTDTLGARQPKREDSFFDIGGHSLLAVRIIGSIRDRFGVELSVVDVFQAATLAELAVRVDAALADLTSMREREAASVETFVV